MPPPVLIGPGDGRPGAGRVRAARGVDHPLHAIAFGKSGLHAAALFDGVEEMPGQPRHRRDASVGILRVLGIGDRDVLVVARTSGMTDFEAAHVVGAGIMQHQSAVFTEEFDAMPGAAIGRAAHRQADQRARLVLQGHGHRGFGRRIVRQAADAGREPADRPGEPFEIMEAVADEIADDPAAIVAADGLPVAHARLDGSAFHLPVDHDMAQRADVACIEHLLDALPGGDLVEIKIDHGRFAGEARLLQHGARAGEVRCHRLFDEHRLAQFERANGDLRLQARQRGNRHGVHVVVLDQLAPAAVTLGDPGFTRELFGPSGVAAGKRHHLAARVGAKGRQLHGAPVIGADDAEADHGPFSVRRKIALSLVRLATS